MWSFTTVTTVDYEDIVPTTIESKTLGIMLIIFRIAIWFGTTFLPTTAIIERKHEEKPPPTKIMNKKPINNKINITTLPQITPQLNIPPNMNIPRRHPKHLKPNPKTNLILTLK